jgi:hypothetical protein
MKRKRYLLILWIISLTFIAFGCATSPFHQTPREKCLALCQADVEECKEGCENSADFEPGAAQCVDQCEKALFSCNEKCPK